MSEITPCVTGKFGQLQMLSAGSSRAQAYPLKPGRFTIGSSQDAYIRIIKNDVAPKLCLIEVCENKMVTLTGTSTFNPTTLNSRTIRRNKREVLKPGDIIELCGVRFVYENSTLSEQKIVQSSTTMVKPLLRFCTPLKKKVIVYGTPRHSAPKYAAASPRSGTRNRVKEWLSEIVTTKQFPSPSSIESGGTNPNAVEHYRKEATSDSATKPSSQHRNITAIKSMPAALSRIPIFVSKSQSQSSTDNDGPELSSAPLTTASLKDINMDIPVIDLITPKLTKTTIYPSISTDSTQSESDLLVVQRKTPKSVAKPLRFENAKTLGSVSRLKTPSSVAKIETQSESDLSVAHRKPPRSVAKSLRFAGATTPASASELKTPSSVAKIQTPDSSASKMSKSILKSDKSAKSRRSVLSNTNSEDTSQSVRTRSSVRLDTSTSCDTETLKVIESSSTFERTTSSPAIFITRYSTRRSERISCISAPSFVDDEDIGEPYNRSEVFLSELDFAETESVEVLQKSKVCRSFNKSKEQKLSSDDEDTSEVESVELSLQKSNSSRSFNRSKEQSNGESMDVSLKKRRSSRSFNESTTQKQNSDNEENVNASHVSSIASNSFIYMTSPPFPSTSRCHSIGIVEKDSSPQKTTGEDDLIQLNNDEDFFNVSGVMPLTNSPSLQGSSKSLRKSHRSSMQIQSLVMLHNDSKRIENELNNETVSEIDNDVEERNVSSSNADAAISGEKLRNSMQNQRMHYNTIVINSPSQEIDTGRSSSSRKSRRTSMQNQSVLYNNPGDVVNAPDEEIVKLSPNSSQKSPRSSVQNLSKVHDISNKFLNTPGQEIAKRGSKSLPKSLRSSMQDQSIVMLHNDVEDSDASSSSADADILQKSLGSEVLNTPGQGTAKQGAGSSRKSLRTPRQNQSVLLNNSVEVANTSSQEITKRRSKSSRKSLQDQSTEMLHNDSSRAENVRDSEEESKIDNDVEDGDASSSSSDADILQQSHGCEVLNTPGQGTAKQGAGSSRKSLRTPRQYQSVLLNKSIGVVNTSIQENVQQSSKSSRKSLRNSLQDQSIVMLHNDVEDSDASSSSADADILQKSHGSEVLNTPGQGTAKQGAGSSRKSLRTPRQNQSVLLNKSIGVVNTSIQENVQQSSKSSRKSLRNSLQDQSIVMLHNDVEDNDASSSSVDADILQKSHGSEVLNTPGQGTAKQGAGSSRKSLRTPRQNQSVLLNKSIGVVNTSIQENVQQSSKSSRKSLRNSLQDQSIVMLHNDVEDNDASSSSVDADILQKSHGSEVLNTPGQGTAKQGAGSSRKSLRTPRQNQSVLLNKSIGVVNTSIQENVQQSSKSSRKSLRNSLQDQSIVMLHNDVEDSDASSSSADADILQKSHGSEVLNTPGQGTAKQGAGSSRKSLRTPRQNQSVLLNKSIGVVNTSIQENVQQSSKSSRKSLRNSLQDQSIVMLHNDVEDNDASSSSVDADILQKSHGSEVLNTPGQGTAKQGAGSSRKSLRTPRQNQSVLLNKSIGVVNTSIQENVQQSSKSSRKSLRNSLQDQSIVMLHNDVEDSDASSSSSDADILQKSHGSEVLNTPGQGTAKQGAGSSRKSLRTPRQNQSVLLNKSIGVVNTSIQENVQQSSKSSRKSLRNSLQDQSIVMLHNDVEDNDASSSSVDADILQKLHGSEVLNTPGQGTAKQGAGSSRKSLRTPRQNQSVLLNKSIGVVNTSIQENVQQSSKSSRKSLRNSLQDQSIVMLHNDVEDNDASSSSVDADILQKSHGSEVLNTPGQGTAKQGAGSSRKSLRTPRQNQSVLLNKSIGVVNTSIQENVQQSSKSSRKSPRNSLQDQSIVMLHNDVEDSDASSSSSDADILQKSHGSEVLNTPGQGTAKQGAGSSRKSLRTPRQNQSVLLNKSIGVVNTPSQEIAQPSSKSSRKSLETPRQNQSVLLNKSIGVVNTSIQENVQQISKSSRKSLRNSLQDQSIVMLHNDVEDSDASSSSSDADISQKPLRSGVVNTPIAKQRSSSSRKSLRTPRQNQSMLFHNSIEVVNTPSQEIAKRSSKSSRKSLRSSMQGRSTAMLHNDSSIDENIHVSETEAELDNDVEDNYVSSPNLNTDNSMESIQHSSSRLSQMSKSGISTSAVSSNSSFFSVGEDDSLNASLANNLRSSGRFNIGTHTEEALHKSPKKSFIDVADFETSLIVSKTTEDKSNDAEEVWKIKLTPKTQYPLFAYSPALLRSPDGPNNDLSNVQGTKRLTSTPEIGQSLRNVLITDVEGTQNLKQTPKVQHYPLNDLSDVRGVKELMATPKVQNSPKNDLTNVAGVKKLLKTPKVQRSPANDLSDVRGLKELMATPKVQHSPLNDLTDVQGVKKLLKTPRVQRSPANNLLDVQGVKRLMKTPRVRPSPKNDLTDVRGVKTLLKTPRVRGSPSNDLRDVRGVKLLMATPKVRHSPKNDLTNVEGVKKLMKTPKPKRSVKPMKSPKNDLTNVSLGNLYKQTDKPQANKELFEGDYTDVRGVKRLFAEEEAAYRNEFNVFGVADIFQANVTASSSEAFDMLIDKRPVRTYRGKSSSPAKLNRLSVIRKSVGAATAVSPDVAEWVEMHSKFVESDSDPTKEVATTTEKFVLSKGSARVFISPLKLSQITAISARAGSSSANRKENTETDDQTISATNLLDVSSSEELKNTTTVQSVYDEHENTQEDIENMGISSILKDVQNQLTPIPKTTLKKNTTANKKENVTPTPQIKVRKLYELISSTPEKTVNLAEGDSARKSQRSHRKPARITDGFVLGTNKSRRRSSVMKIDQEDKQMLEDTQADANSQQLSEFNTKEQTLKSNETKDAVLQSPGKVKKRSLPFLEGNEHTLEQKPKRRRVAKKSNAENEAPQEQIVSRKKRETEDVQKIVPKPRTKKETNSSKVEENDEKESVGPKRRGRKVEETKETQGEPIRKEGNDYTTVVEDQQVVNHSTRNRGMKKEAEKQDISLPGTVKRAVRRGVKKIESKDDGQLGASIEEEKDQAIAGLRTRRRARKLDDETMEETDSSKIDDNNEKQKVTRTRTTKKVEMAVEVQKPSTSKDNCIEKSNLTRVVHDKKQKTTRRPLRKTRISKDDNIEESDSSRAQEDNEMEYLPFSHRVTRKRATKKVVEVQKPQTVEAQPIVTRKRTAKKDDQEPSITRSNALKRPTTRGAQKVYNEAEDRDDQTSEDEVLNQRTRRANTRKLNNKIVGDAGLSKNDEVKPKVTLKRGRATEEIEEPNEPTSSKSDGLSRTTKNQTAKPTTRSAKKARLEHPPHEKKIEEESFEETEQKTTQKRTVKKVTFKTPMKTSVKHRANNKKSNAVTQVSKPEDTIEEPSLKKRERRKAVEARDEQQSRPPKNASSKKNPSRAASKQDKKEGKPATRAKQIGNQTKQVAEDVPIRKSARKR